MAAKGHKGKVSEEAIEKKMASFNNSQDSVQALSMWIMHHKAHHRKIVDVWLKVLKSSDSRHKLTLMYLCNDVVQQAKRKKALYYLEMFKHNLREAISIISEYDAIKPNVTRIFKIWGERKIYDMKYIGELKGILENESGGTSSHTSSATATPNTPTVAYKPSVKGQDNKPSVQEVREVREVVTTVTLSADEQEEVNSKILAEFKTRKFIDGISHMKATDDEAASKEAQVSALRIDATNTEALKQLKDRSHGKEFCKNFEESCVKIEEYVQLLESEIEQKQRLLAFCQDSEVYYDEQFKEARIVANAYRNFGARISNMKKKVDDVKKLMPGTPSPVSSPSADAPSPGNTPTLENMDDNDYIDMELESDEKDTKKLHESGSTVRGRMAYTAMVKYISQPIPSYTDISLATKDGVNGKASTPEMARANSGDDKTPEGNVLESRIATMLPNLAMGTSTIAGAITSVADPGRADCYTPPKPTRSPPKPTRSTNSNSSERASTPVLDEQDETTPPRITTPKTPKTPKSSSTKTTTSTTKAVKTNPIDFLSQLLTKTSSTSSSSNFLHSLSLLTNTVKSQYQQQKQAQEAASQKDLDRPPHDGSMPPGQLQDGVMPSGVLPPKPVTQSSSWGTWTTVAPNPPLPDGHPDVPTPPTEPPRQPPQPPAPTPPPQPPSPIQAYPDQQFVAQGPVSQPYPMPPSSQNYPPPPPGNVFPANTSQPYSIPPQGAQHYQGQTTLAAPTYPGQPPVSQPFSAPPPQGNTDTYPTSPVTPQPPQTSVPMLVTNLRPASEAAPPFNPSPSYNPAVVFPYSQPPPPPPQRQSMGPGFYPGIESQQPPSSPRSDPKVQEPYTAPTPPASNTQPWLPNRQQNPAQFETQLWNPEPPPPPPEQRDDSDYRNPWRDQSDNSQPPAPPESENVPYRHPWDQGYDDDDPSEDTPPPPPLPTPTKGILRNRSSLREITIIDDDNVNSVTTVPPNTTEIKPVGILKKSSVDPHPGVLIKPPVERNIVDHPTDVQSEFIAKLKQKTTNLVVPQIQTQDSGEVGNGMEDELEEYIPQDVDSIDASGDASETHYGEVDEGTIEETEESTHQIGVLGNNASCRSLVDMEIDDDDDGSGSNGQKDSSVVSTEDFWAEANKWHNQTSGGDGEFEAGDEEGDSQDEPEIQLLTEQENIGIEENAEPPEVPPPPPMEKEITEGQHLQVIQRDRNRDNTQHNFPHEENRSVVFHQESPQHFPPEGAQPPGFPHKEHGPHHTFPQEQSHRGPRPMHPISPRPRFDQFRPRGHFNNFSDNRRPFFDPRHAGPPRGKRPFFSAGPRMPYYRY